MVQASYFSVPLFPDLGGLERKTLVFYLFAVREADDFVDF